MTHTLEGWDINRSVDVEWVPWGERRNAKARILGTADGYIVALVSADAGYEGTPHEHTNAEFLYVVDGVVRNQGELLGAGDGYAAAAGSLHTDFEALSAATYLSIFKV